MSALLQLAERCEAATGPDKCLNHEISELCFRLNSKEYSFLLMPVTEQIRDALCLLDKRALWAVGEMEEGPFARLCWPTPDGGYTGGSFEVFAATPALALCAAALRARAAQGGQQ